MTEFLLQVKIQLPSERKRKEFLFHATEEDWVLALDERKRLIYCYKQNKGTKSLHHAKKFSFQAMENDESLAPSERVSMASRTRIKVILTTSDKVVHFWFTVSEALRIKTLTTRFYFYQWTRIVPLIFWWFIFGKLLLFRCDIK